MYDIAEWSEKDHTWYYLTLIRDGGAIWGVTSPSKMKESNTSTSVSQEEAIGFFNKGDANGWKGVLVKDGVIIRDNTESKFDYPSFYHNTEKPNHFKELDMSEETPNALPKKRGRKPKSDKSQIARSSSKVGRGLLDLLKRLSFISEWALFTNGMLLFRNEDGTEVFAKVEEEFSGKVEAKKLLKVLDRLSDSSGKLAFIASNERLVIQSDKLSVRLPLELFDSEIKGFSGEFYPVPGFMPAMAIVAPFSATSLKVTGAMVETTDRVTACQAYHGIPFPFPFSLYTQDAETLLRACKGLSCDGLNFQGESLWVSFENGAVVVKLRMIQPDTVDLSALFPAQEQIDFLTGNGQAELLAGIEFIRNLSDSGMITVYPEGISSEVSFLTFNSKLPLHLDFNRSYDPILVLRCKSATQIGFATDSGKLLAIGSTDNVQWRAVVSDMIQPEPINFESQGENE